MKNRWYFQLVSAGGWMWMAADIVLSDVSVMAKICLLLVLVVVVPVALVGD